MNFREFNIRTPPPIVGYWRLGGLRFALSKRPRLFTRWFARWLLEWEWEDAR
jgi:hypothetical protein